MLPKVWTEPFQREIIDELRLDAAKRFRRFQLPESRQEWEAKRPELLKRLNEKLHLQVDHDLDLDLHETGVVILDGYSIHQLYYQSRPGFYVTASLYVPDGKGPFPAIVNMHGHWNQGRLAARIQNVGHLMAKSGYVVLAVDAFGSGERCTVHGEFEYHGAFLGGMLLNIGESLMGIQIIDNMRAVDLLCSLPMVDRANIGATGGSGGGNQTMYLAAFDERIKAAVPVVSVGSYQSYIGGTNCVCELLPDGLTFCEESALLALIAPRALKICNALHDCNPTFFVPEMMRTFTEAQKVYIALDAYDRISAMAFNDEHSYPPEVQAAMLGFFNFYLRGIGHGQPVAPPPFETLPEEQLMVFPKGKRFSGVVSIAEYIDRRGPELCALANGTPEELCNLLRINGDAIRDAVYLSSEEGWEKYTVESTSGRMLPFLLKRGSNRCCRILAAPGGKAELESAGLAVEAETSGDSVLIFDQWGHGECGYIDEQFPGFAEQHQMSRTLIWLGRRLMGEWMADYLLAAEFIREKLPEAGIRLIGRRDSGVAALFSAVLNPDRIERITLVDAPSTLIRNGVPNAKYLTMACCIPDILTWGDLDHAVKLVRIPVEFIRPRRFDGTLEKEENRG